MTKSKELRESHSRDKLLNMNKSPELKEFQLKGPSLTIMPLRLKLNIFRKKLKRLSLNMNQLREHGKEFNICQLKHKLFTTQKGTTTLQDKANTSKEVTHKSAEARSKEPPTFHLKAESEPKPSIKPVTSHPPPQ